MLSKVINDLQLDSSSFPLSLQACVNKGTQHGYRHNQCFTLLLDHSTLNNDLGNVN